jgi:MoaA/NifB/PqqE/SkfB family radical SAM enzyme
MQLSILYRGPLSSCNYGCTYCPFAKHSETDTEHSADAIALEKFVRWVEGRDQDSLSIFFTPWGEALIRSRYQRAVVRLSNLPQVEKVVVQTNLSCRLDWADQCSEGKLALWVTYHPTQVSRRRFLEQCRRLDSSGIRYSVGIVGMKEHVEEIDAMRRELPQHVYLWINAYKRVEEYYSGEESRRFTEIDPLFPINNVRHPSKGRVCGAGDSVIAVDGDGNMRRCHFIQEPIGNLYAADFEQSLMPRPCTNETCGCHIGYVHIPELKLYDVFKNGVLERIPATWPIAHSES